MAHSVLDDFPCLRGPRIDATRLDKVSPSNSPTSPVKSPGFGGCTCPGSSFTRLGDFNMNESLQKQKSCMSIGKEHAFGTSVPCDFVKRQCAQGTAPGACTDTAVDLAAGMNFCT